MNESEMVRNETLRGMRTCYAVLQVFPAVVSCGQGEENEGRSLSDSRGKVIENEL